MKQLTIFSLLLILFTLPLCLYAQNTRIAGTVVVEGTKLPLIGANIVVVDANLGASTDAPVFFLIGNVPAGTYEVEAYYIGFIKPTKTVVVKSGEVAQVAFVLKTSILESDESIQVTSDRIIQSQKAALNAQLNASNILEASYPRISLVLSLMRMHKLLSHAYRVCLLMNLLQLCAVFLLITH